VVVSHAIARAPWWRPSPPRCPRPPPQRWRRARSRRGRTPSARTPSSTAWCRCRRCVPRARRLARAVRVVAVALESVLRTEPDDAWDTGAAAPLATSSHDCCSPPPRWWRRLVFGAAMAASGERQWRRLLTRAGVGAQEFVAYLKEDGLFLPDNSAAVRLCCTLAARAEGRVRVSAG
jgi:hypothetical protein